MNFFGLLWIVSYISNFSAPTLLFKLPHWAGGFLATDAAVSQSFSGTGVSSLLKATVGLKDSRFKLSLLKSDRRVLLRLTRSTLTSSIRWNYQTFSRSSQALQRSIRSIPTNITAACAGQGVQSAIWQAVTPPKSALIEVKQSSAKNAFQVWIKGREIAKFPTHTQADLLAQRLQKSLEAGFDPGCLQPRLVEGKPSAMAGNTLLFAVDSKLANSLNRTRDLIAIDWVNNLRQAFDVEPLTLVEAQTLLHGLVETDTQLAGTASWYGPYFHGRLTATGETFDQNALTAAHPSLPFDTFLKVTNLENGKSVIVRVNDRGPYVGDRSLDLSREAARSLESETSGVVSYQAVIMKPASLQTAASEKTIAAAYDLTSGRAVAASKIR